MKKIIAVIAFFAITLLGTDATFAQEANKNNLSDNAKTFAHELSKKFDLDGTQQRAIYNAHMLRNRKINALPTATVDYKAMEKGGKTSSLAAEYILDFNAKLKSVLSEKQYLQYQKLKAEKQSK